MVDRDANDCAISLPPLTSMIKKRDRLNTRLRKRRHNFEVNNLSKTIDKLKTLKKIY